MNWKSPFTRNASDLVDRVIAERILPALRLTDDRSERLAALAREFLRTREFIGRDGFVLTDEMKATIAAHACVLALGWDKLWPLRRAAAVSVHAATFGETVEAIGPDGQRYQVQSLAAGRAWQLGVVELAWDGVVYSLADPHDGINVIYHEFAHVLDAGDGAMEGVPPLRDASREPAWTHTLQAGQERLRWEHAAGRPSAVSSYGREALAEFFAVCTEAFFERPTLLHRWDIPLYDMLASFYAQDPREYERPVSGSPGTR